MGGLHPFSDFKPQRFFEMLFSGIHLSLLCREILITETVPQYDNFTFRTYFATRTRIQREYFLMFPGKNVQLVSGRKKDLLNQLAEEKEEMKKFMKPKTGIAHITVYEGDRSGKGRISKADKGGGSSWQEHRPTSSYVDEVKSVFPEKTTLPLSMTIARSHKFFTAAIL